MLIIGLFSMDNSTNEMIISYLNSNNITVQEKPLQISHITIPNNFDKIYETYNEIQNQSGFDLIPYKGKTVIKYTYKVITINQESITAYANIFLYDNTIIAADISNTSQNGFIKSIPNPKAE